MTSRNFHTSVSAVAFTKPSFRHNRCNRKIWVYPNCNNNLIFTITGHCRIVSCNSHRSLDLNWETRVQFLHLIKDINSLYKKCSSITNSIYRLYKSFSHVTDFIIHLTQRGLWLRITTLDSAKIVASFEHRGKEKSML